jgi:hypothetical protein
VLADVCCEAIVGDAKTKTGEGGGEEEDAGEGEEEESQERGGEGETSGGAEGDDAKTKTTHRGGHVEAPQVDDLASDREEEIARREQEDGIEAETMQRELVNALQEQENQHKQEQANRTAAKTTADDAKFPGRSPAADANDGSA